jgi:hypothetical protein
VLSKRNFVCRLCNSCSVKGTSSAVCAIHLLLSSGTAALDAKCDGERGGTETGRASSEAQRIGDLLALPLGLAVEALLSALVGLRNSVQNMKRRHDNDAKMEARGGVNL